jgi:enamine deaminase RidA (YjgF/YER057c/UK114 family)
VRIVDCYAYVSGHTATDGSERLIRGKIGAELTEQQGQKAAHLAALSMIASLKRELGDLDRLSSWVKVLGFVNCASGFSATPLVLNGFSDAIIQIWGERGRHARSAVGVAELPFDVPVEIEAIVEIETAGLSHEGCPGEGSFCGTTRWRCGRRVLAS